MSAAAPVASSSRSTLDSSQGDKHSPTTHTAWTTAPQQRPPSPSNSIKGKQRQQLSHVSELRTIERERSRESLSAPPSHSSKFETDDSKRSHDSTTSPNSTPAEFEAERGRVGLSFALPRDGLAYDDRANAFDSTNSANAHSPGAGVETEGIATTGTGWNTRSWKLHGDSRKFDKKRLAALGFEEELTRNFDVFASIGIGLCNIGGFNGTVMGVITAMETGGGSMYAWAWPISGLFMLALAAVLGEMASTWPVAGAMFTWVFRLCRSVRGLDPFARYFSWVTGSFLLCYHILIQIVIDYQLAHGIATVNQLYSGSQWSFWPMMGACWAVLILTGIVVSSPLSRSPWTWRVCGFLVVASFVVTNVVLLTKTNQIRSAQYVFFDFRSDAGFSSKAYVYLIGWCLTCVASGMEASAHIAEDTKRPSRTVPLGMFWSTAVSYMIGWVSICVLVATTDPTDLDPNLSPSVALLNKAIGRSYTTLIMSLVLMCLAFQNVAQLLATSRFIWALARESALPFSRFFHTLSASDKQPLVAIWSTVAVVGPALLLLRISVNIVGTILLEGAAWAVMFTYGGTVALYLFCAKDVLRGDGRAKWSLRNWSRPLGAAGVVFAALFLIVLCFPTESPVTPLTASYASVVAAGTLLFSTLAWVFYGNAHYAGPIKTTTRWTVGAEIELPHSNSQKSNSQPINNAPVSDEQQQQQTSSAAHGRSAHVFSESQFESTWDTRATTTSYETEEEV